MLSDSTPSVYSGVIPENDSFLPSCPGRQRSAGPVLPRDFDAPVSGGAGLPQPRAVPNKGWLAGRAGRGRAAQTGSGVGNSSAGPPHSRCPAQAGETGGVVRVQSCSPAAAAQLCTAVGALLQYCSEHRSAAAESGAAGLASA